MSHASPALACARSGAVALALATLLHAPSMAGPTIGFVETFPGAGNFANWGGGALLSNPGTGGVGGVGDGFLQITTLTADGHLGTKTEGTDYIGNWLTAGADRVKFSLNDVGGNQVLEIHMLIGNQSNLWLCNTGFIPPNGAWSEFSVNLSDSANFTHVSSIDGKGYRFALANTDRVLVRHGNAPFMQTPDLILGEFGIDDFKIESTTVGVDQAPLAGSRGVLLAPPFPNPARDAGVTIAFESFDEAPVTISIVDARGRIVRRAVVAGAAGRRGWAWDCRDDAGRATAAGVYRVRAYGPAGGTSRALVRVD